MVEALVLEEEFAAIPASSRVKRATELFGEKLAVTTGLGYSGVVLLDFLRRLAPSTEIHFIDTCLHFDETREFLNDLCDGWGLNVRVTGFPFPELLDMLVGEKAWEKNPNLCCHYRKVDPLLRLLGGKDAWMSAVRRDQSKLRASIKAVELDGRGIVRIHPLYDWTSEQAWDYIREKELPYNKLHDSGFLSVGCWPCTSRIGNDGKERAGRWNCSKKTECGMFE